MEHIVKFSYPRFLFIYPRLIEKKAFKYCYVFYI